MTQQNITALMHYSLEDPLRGGQFRTYYLFRFLSKKYNITLLTLEYRECEKSKSWGKFIEIHIKKNNLLDSFLWSIIGITLGCNGCWPMICSISTFFNREYGKESKKYIAQSKVVILEHPYLFMSIKRFLRRQIVIYNAHNVEYIYQKSILGKSFLAKLFSIFVKFIENKSCWGADIILTTSEHDRKKIHKLYKVPLNKILVVPNGTDPNTIKPCLKSTKGTIKSTLNLETKKIILFIGSNHPPNLEALEFIIFQLQPQLHDFYFLVCGPIGSAFLEKHGDSAIKLTNVRFAGLVSEDVKLNLLNAADIAINPMFSGSGTNIKMLEYMAAGIPVVTTPFGARGLEIKNAVHAVIADKKDFAKSIKELYEDGTLCEELRSNARKLVEEKYDWQKITQDMEYIIQKNLKSQACQ
ncbi:glycosyltransferase family 4 protein [Candidatus Omnitrophota bacterium]